MGIPGSLYEFMIGDAWISMNAFKQFRVKKLLGPPTKVSTNKHILHKTWLSGWRCYCLQLGTNMSKVKVVV